MTFVPIRTFPMRSQGSEIKHDTKHQKESPRDMQPVSSAQQGLKLWASNSTAIDVGLFSRHDFIRINSPARPRGLCFASSVVIG